ncbi:MAG: phosphotransferase [Legionella sp.]|nr:phosphotransferase [Legionella sp.]
MFLNIHQTSQSDIDGSILGFTMPGGGFMLNKAEVQNIAQNYKVDFDTHQIIPLTGGEVNSTYLLQSDMDKYVIKKILLEQCVDEYQKTIDEVALSLHFVEEITRKQQPLGNVVTAVSGDTGSVLQNANNAYVLYPFYPGEILENNKITLHMVKQISQRLKMLHHHPFSYDHELSRKRYTRFFNIGHAILDNSLLNDLISIKRLVPKLKPIINFITDNKSSLADSINLCTPGSVCHNDLKPKNVLWASQNNFAIIDWESASDFDHRTDYLDTLICWSNQKEQDQFNFTPHKIQAFQEHYFIPKKELSYAMDIVIIKWYFWLFFCINKARSYPEKFLHYLEQSNIALKFIEFLIKHRDLSFLNK